MAPKGTSAPKRKRQTKLNFSPGANSSPASKQSAAPAMGTSLSRRVQSKPTNSALKPAKASKESLVFSSSEDELAVETEKSLQLGGHVKSTPLGMFNSSIMGGARSESEEEDEEKEEQIKSKRAGRKRRRAKDTDEEDSGEGTVTVIPRKRQRRVDTEVDESEDDIEELPVPAKRRRTRRQATLVEEQPQTPPRRSRRREPEREIPSEVEDEEEASEPSHSQPRRRRLTRRPHVSDEEVEDDPEEGRTGEESGKENGEENSEEDDDLKEDLAFLRSSPLPNRGRLRSTQDKPKSERQKALEALKQRRAGTQDPSSSATPARKKMVVIDSESDLELEVIKEEVDSDEDVLGQEDIEDDEDEDEGDRDANILDMFQEDGEDAGFIDDDAEALIGEPSANADLDELRLALSLSRAKSKELFRHAVEWMVMKKIHPAFDSTANIYTLTFRKLDDEVKGLAGSKFTSSAWTADFTRSLRARPDIFIDETTNAMRELTMPHCEACNRSNHTARFELMLTGQPYDAETLEPLDNNPDSDSDSDSSDDSEISADSETRLNGEKPTFDARGERLPPESHRFPLGSTCKANAQVAHTLHHWRYHLYQWVKDYLAREGHLTAEKLVKRDKSSDRKRQKEAMKIVDRMDSDGEVVKLYRQYKDQVKFAVEARNDYKAGWGR